MERGAAACAREEGREGRVIGVVEFSRERPAATPRGEGEREKGKIFDREGSAAAAAAVAVGRVGVLLVVVAAIAAFASAGENLCQGVLTMGERVVCCC